MKRILLPLFSALAVPILLFEEWGWEPLAALMARLARLPLWSALERRIVALPPWGAMVVFCLPTLLLVPVKLFALYLFTRGHVTTGFVFLAGAKLAATAIVARLFHLTQPILMRVAWFARWYPRWKAWKDGVLARVRDSAPWRAARRAKTAGRRWWRSLRRAP